MIIDVASINNLLSLLTIFGQLIIALIFVSFLLNKFTPKLLPQSRSLLNFISSKAILFSFIVALVSTLGSLYYSEIAGYNPCKLCWYQRIFMYPLVPMFAWSLFKKDRSSISYGIIFALFGGLIALDHYYLQTTGNSLVPCSTVGYSAACSQRFVMSYGYITIPLMALTAFLMILTFLTVARIYPKAKTSPSV